MHAINIYKNAETHIINHSHFLRPVVLLNLTQRLIILIIEQLHVCVLKFVLREAVVCSDCESGWCKPWEL